MYALTDNIAVPRLRGQSADQADDETPESFEDTYRRCRPGLVRLAHLVTGSATPAEDVVHDAWV